MPTDGLRKLLDKGRLERSLFDEQHRAEISAPDFPGARLVACYQPILAERRQRKREALLAATEVKLQGLAREVGRRTKKPLKKDEIGGKVGRVLHQHQVGKHFRLTIDDNLLTWERQQPASEREAGLDGI